MQVTVDNCTTSSYTVVNLVCRDRKGLVYDLFRTLKDIHIRVAYAKVRAAAAFGCSHEPGKQHRRTVWVLERPQVLQACRRYTGCSTLHAPGVHTV